MRSYASAVLAVALSLSVCLSVCLSITSWYCIKTAAQNEFITARRYAKHSICRRRVSVRPSSLLVWILNILGLVTSFSIIVLISIFFYFFVLE